MSELRIDISEANGAFKPGEQVSGRVSWLLEDRPEQISLRLFWYTRGRGTEDVVLVEEQNIETHSAHETREFSLSLPIGPYSFSGKLIALIWALELVASPSEDVVRREIVVSPWGKEVALYEALSQHA